MMGDFPESALNGAADRIRPMVRRHADDVYEAVMDSVQDYLIENAQFNIRSRIDTAQREVEQARSSIAKLEAERDALREALMQIKCWLSSVAACDMDEIVADGGVTAAMVIRQEAAHQQKRARAALDAATHTPAGN